MDPPPWYVLQGTPQQQAEYISEISSESEHLRAQVAKKRFDERQYRHKAITAGLQSELNAQRELLAAQMRAAGQSQDVNLSEASGFFKPMEALSLSRIAIAGAFFLFLFILYRFRTTFFGLDPVTKAHRRAQKASQHWT